MVPTLYYLPEGPPSRGVLFLIRYLNIDVNLKLCRTYMDEHKDPKYLKLNPCHTVPVLEDNGLVLIDSHAIAIYLVEQYGTKSNLFGNTVKERALITQRLFFNSTLFEEVKRLLVPVFYEGIREYDEKVVLKIQEMLGFLETFLKETSYVAGSFLTIADFFLVNNILTFMHLGWDFSKFKHINDWVQRLKVLTGFAECDEGAANGATNLILPKLK